jgi:transcriptional regulator with XRE-family HTH domain
MMIEMNSDLFCIRLKEIRKMKNDTAELSEKSGIPSTSIAHIEAGSRKPSLENFYKLVVVLNVSADYLLGCIDQHTHPGVIQLQNLFKNYLNQKDR